jgi:ribosome maturation factor RimP
VEAARRLVAPALARLGLELYDVELVGGAGARTLRLTIVKDGGVDLDAVTTATQTVSPLLDNEPGLTGPYLLEVSSPGIERQLRRPDHFTHALGERVSVKYHTAEGPRRVIGILRAADADAVVVEADEGGSVAVEPSSITQARTVFEWGPSPRPKAGDRGKARARAKGSR